jgi:hypothetical protein
MSMPIKMSMRDQDLHTDQDVHADHDVHAGFRIIAISVAAAISPGER